MRERNPDWPAGYVHTQKNGQRLYVIERQVTVAGTRHRFHLSTGAHSLKPALEQLARFEADPFSYSRAGGDLRAPLLLTAELIERLHDWQLANHRSPKYARETSTWLIHWLKRMRGVNLRRLSLARDVLPVLDAVGGARRPMMASLKTLCAWLRMERHELTTAEDATLDLRLPKPPPKKHSEEVVVPLRDVRRAAKHLQGAYLDALHFQMGTAAHITELERFIRDERSRLVVFPKARRAPDGGKVLAVVVLFHKTKKWHRINLTKAVHVEAAKRLRARGAVPKLLNAHLYAACDKARVKRFSYKLRHSVLSWARGHGVAKQALADFAGHEDSRTTEKHYLDTDLPATTIPVETL